MASVLKKLVSAGLIGAGSGALLLIPTPKMYSKLSSWIVPRVAAVDFDDDMVVPEVKIPWNSDWDKRMMHQPNPNAVRNLYLIRHGQYQERAAEPEKKLTTLGAEQALRTGERLKTLLDGKVDKFHVSTMIRARQTVGHILKSFPNYEATQENLIAEGCPIRPDPPEEDWNPTEPQIFKDSARLAAGYAKFFHRADPSQTCPSHEVIVCHANVIRYAALRAMQVPPEAWIRLDLAHGSITHIAIHPDGSVQLKSLGDAGFLPTRMLSGR